MMKKSFEKKYAIHVSSMKYGAHEDQLTVDQEFFEHFAESETQDGKVEVHLDMFRYDTHVDVRFKLDGYVVLNCDRCLEPYESPVSGEHRIIYSFDKEMDFKGYEVMFVDPYAPYLSIVQELYDFISIAIPLRRVPDESIHQCDPEVTAYILSEDGESKGEDGGDGEIDPRWEALKKLKK